MGIEVPFQHTLRLLGPQGEIVRVAALFDGCAMVAAMCVTVFEKVKHRLGKWDKSDRQLRMGNGVIVPSLAVWRGKMQLGKVTVEGEYHARRLREFVPREGTKLAAEQKEREESRRVLEEEKNGDREPESEDFEEPEREVKETNNTEEHEA